MKANFGLLYFNNIIDKLELLNPLKIIGRGYSITYSNDKIVKSIKDVKVNDEIKIKVTDGFINTKVVGVKEEL